MDSVSLLKNVRENLPAENDQNVNIREELLLEARKLMLSLERKDNSVERVSFQIWETIACRIAVDVGIFKILVESASPQTTEQVAQKTDGADPIFIGRVLRCLESFGVIDGDDEAGYSASTTAQAFADIKHQACLKSCFDFLSPAWLVVPQFLKDMKYQNPTSGTVTPFSKSYGFKDGATLWEILGTTSYMPEMGLWMSSFNDGHKNFLDIYPVAERLGNGASTDPQAVMMVDIGGGQGHQAIAMKERFPDIPGRYIVTDLAHGLPTETEGKSVEFLVHDFMTEQPVKGARCYYLRYISHDWPQVVLVKILTHLRKVMKPGYSRVIINDWVVPTKGASKFMTAQDLNMMSIGGGMERTEALHRDYIEKAGLRISGIWRADDKISESVIEAELPLPN